MFRLPKATAHTGAMVQSLGRTEKTLHKLAIAVSVCKAMNHEKLKPLFCFAKQSFQRDTVISLMVWLPNTQD